MSSGCTTKMIWDKPTDCCQLAGDTIPLEPKNQQGSSNETSITRRHRQACFIFSHFHNPRRNPLSNANMQFDPGQMTNMDRSIIDFSCQARIP